MRIALLTSTYPPLVGGAETYARVLAGGLAAAGHDVTVITDGAWVELPAREHTDDGVLVVRPHEYADGLQARDRVLWRLMQFSALAEIERLTRDRTFDLVHANSYETAILGAQIALQRGIPLVASLHEQWPERDPFGVGRCRLVYERLPIELVLAASDYYVEKAATFGVPAERIRRIYHGIDVDRFGDRHRAAGRARFAPEGSFLLVCAGRVYERKGQRHLVEALPALRRARPDLHVVLAGAISSFAYADALAARIAELGLAEAVTLRTDLVLDDMPELFAAADLVVQPSLAEGLGLSVIEAMAAAKPIVATDVTGIAEVVRHGVDGILVPPGDASPLAEALVEAASDVALRERLAARARAAAAERFSEQRMVRETLAAYEQVPGG